MDRFLAGFHARSVAFAWVCIAVGCVSIPPSTTTGTSATGTTPAGSSSTGSSRASGSSGSGGGVSSGTSTGTANGSTNGAPQCVTAADCQDLDACLDGGVCGNPASEPTLDCVAVGATCAAEGIPCCQGSCGAGGVCTPWSACGLIGQQCGSSDNCCWSEACDAGTCVPGCGNLTAPCGTNSDCCGYDGLTCQVPETLHGSLFECLGANGGAACTAQAAPGSPQCQLGTTCRVASGADPCMPAGLVCDPFYGTCREPKQYEKCVPGGPACAGVTNTSIAALRCIYQPSRGYAECLQPCEETSDCESLTGACKTVSGVAGGACFGNYDCNDYFGSCNAETINDGTCEPVETSSGVEGLCVQSNPDGGASCSPTENRQNGGACVLGERCVGGLCTSLCNGGTSSSGPSCAAGTCLAGSLAPASVDYGVCEIDCDFTDPGGGGCPSTPEVPEKCISEFQDGFPDEGKGMCVLEVANPPQLYGACSQQDPLHVDTCGAGQACAAHDDLIVCVQLCKSPGSQSNCPAGQQCLTWHRDGVASSSLGFCN